MQLITYKFVDIQVVCNGRLIDLGKSVYLAIAILLCIVFLLIVDDKKDQALLFNKLFDLVLTFAVEARAILNSNNYGTKYRITICAVES